MPSLKVAILKVFADLLCLFILLIPLWVYNLLHVTTLNRQGFFCSDASIMYPYKSSTISSLVLFSSGFGFLIIYTGGVEFYIHYNNKKSKSNEKKDSLFHPLLVGMYRCIGFYLVGGCINQFVTDIGKESIGRPRPHFFDMCQPNVTCSDMNPYVYIEDYVCTRTSHPEVPASQFQDRLDDARKSLPSGHGSFAAFTAVYLIIYLELRLKKYNLRIFKQLFQCGILAWAFWIGCSRVSDFKHRYSDVIAGFVLGTLIASLTIYAYNNSLSFEKKKKRESILLMNTSRYDETNNMLRMSGVNSTNPTALNHVADKTSSQS